MSAAGEAAYNDLMKQITAATAAVETESKGAAS
jgi:hypothetical protein